MLNDLKEIIEIKSVLSAAEKNAPFGEGNRQALDWFLKKAKSYGLKTGEMDGYCGWAEYGSGDQIVAALCHLDVVPVGEGWTNDPFTLTERNGRLYGRGVSDDKAAAVMCLHALKQIKGSKTRLSKRVRVIVGLNEEHGSACMHHYVHNGGEIPVMSIVPDADFPIINSEKGILHLKINSSLDKFFEKNIAHMSGCKSVNVIPDHASVSVFKDSPLGRKLVAMANGALDARVFSAPELVGSILASGASPDAYSIKTEAEVITVEAAGAAGHAMAPKKGDNAIWKIITFLDALAGSEPNIPSSQIVDFLKDYICTQSSPEKLGIYKSDAGSGETTVSMGVIEITDRALSFTLDIRLPISAKVEDVKKSIVSALPTCAKMESPRWSPNLYIDKDSELVKTLLDVYTCITGKEGFCLKSGGGTYARALPNAIAFGPLFPGEDGNIHKADENMLLEDFYKAFEIYKEAFIRLAK